MLCLLVRTPEKKEFLTPIKNYTLLIEYANTFGGRLYTVETEEGTHVLQIEDLAIQICAGEGISKSIHYDIIKKHSSIAKSSKRLDEQKIAASIRQFIEEQLMDGKPISLLAIKHQFCKYNLRTCTVSNHFAFTRKKMTINGSKIERVGHGIYQKKD